MSLSPDRFLPSDQVQDAGGLNLLLYGPAGVGKTVLCSTLADVPGMDHVLLVDFDNGSRSITPRKNLTIFHPQSWAEMGEIYSLCTNGAWKGLIIDSLSAAYRLCMASVLKKANRDLPIMEGWGKSNDYAEVNERILKMVFAFAQLAHHPGVQVIFTAWEKMTETGTGDKKLVRYGPGLSDKIATDSRYLVDSVARLTKSSRGRILTLTSDSSMIVTKWRSPPGVTVPAELINPTLPQLFNLLNTRS